MSDSVSLVDGHIDPDKNRMTNFEKIKTMSIDEMVEFLEAACDSSCITICNNYDRCIRNNAIEPICKNHYKEWLESEVEEK